MYIAFYYEWILVCDMLYNNDSFLAFLDIVIKRINFK